MKIQSPRIWEFYFFAISKLLFCNISIVVVEWCLLLGINKFAFFCLLCIAAIVSGSMLITAGGVVFGSWYNELFLCNPPRLPIIPLATEDEGGGFFFSKSKNELLFAPLLVRMFDIFGPLSRETLWCATSLFLLSALFSPASVPPLLLNKNDRNHTSE